MRNLIAISICLCMLTVVVGQDRIPRADRVKMRETRETMRGLHLDLTTYQQIHAEYPDSLKALIDNQLREAVPQDGWGREFQYSLTDNGFRLVSLGSDGKSGGEGGAADIVWTQNGEFREMTADEKAERERRQQASREQALRLLARRRMEIVACEVVNYRREQTRWPNKLDDCKRTGNSAEDQAVNACFADPFGHGFQFKQLPKENFAIICWGADGKEDGEGRDADFVVTEREVRKVYNDYRDYWRYDPWNNDWQVENLANDVERYLERFGRLPAELADLTRGGNDPDGKALPPIRNSIPRDSWGNEYVLVALNDTEFVVAGLGKDQVEGGIQDNADVIFPVPGKAAESAKGMDFAEIKPQQNDDEILHEIARELMNDIITKVVAHHADTGSYPAALGDIAEQFPDETVPLDPWENAFVYTLTLDADGGATGFTLTCYGSDGAEGGENWAADITLNQAFEEQ